ncbi:MULTISPECIES: DUF3099 domain-containing protein [Rothia]|uniref:DUF3099 domain-containing protein n=1 Tax=Rothia nasimurium TaxID=85336 RepID=A0A1Y1RQ86_9MICC|nr:MULTISPECIES: DUF3099 domain-containing protein [Rothia]ORC21954.1 hypothetical protein A7979_00025 [Rothia nasimurium]
MGQKYWTAEDLTAAGYATGESEVFEITDASERQSVGVSSRAKVYAFKMFLRIVCIVAAVSLGGVWMWIFLIAAALLPWSAVVVANGETRQSGGGFSAMLPPEQQAAIAEAQADRVARSAQAQSSEPGAGQQEPGDVSAEPVVIDGEIVIEDCEGAGRSGAVR